MKDTRIHLGLLPDVLGKEFGQRQQDFQDFVNHGVVGFTRLWVRLDKLRSSGLVETWQASRLGEGGKGALRSDLLG